MKTSFLFSNLLKKVDWFVLIPATILGILVISSDFEIPFLTMKVFALFTDGQIVNGQEVAGPMVENNLTNELAGVTFLIGALLIGFSKVKEEDEYIAKVRLESLVWASYLNYGFLLFSLVFVYGLPFLTFMVFNMFTLLIFFIIRFHLALGQNNYSLKAHAE